MLHCTLLLCACASLLKMESLSHLSITLTYKLAHNTHTHTHTHAAHATTLSQCLYNDNATETDTDTDTDTETQRSTSLPHHGHKARRALRLHCVNACGITFNPRPTQSVGSPRISFGRTSSASTFQSRTTCWNGRSGRTWTLVRAR